MLIAELMTYAATLAAERGVRVASALGIAPAKELNWAFEAGLGPLLHHATLADAERLPATVRSVLLGANLTAQVLQAERLDTVGEIIDICTDIGVPVVLLKGISVSTQFYPESHFRPMTDVDILVPEAGAVAVEAIALRKGFQHGRPVMEPNSHHREPLYHREKHTKVEIHTGLFQNPRLRQGRLFDPARVLLESVPCQIHGRQARCLPDDLQLAYIASSWTKDLSEQPIHPSLITPVFDAIHLLRASGGTLDWHKLFASLDNELAAASLYVLIVCLVRMNHPGVPPSLVAALRDRQSIIGERELRILLALIDDFLVAGRPFPFFNSWHVWVNLFKPGAHTGKLLMLPWRIAFPPTYPHRFNVLLQARRVKHWFRG